MAIRDDKADKEIKNQQKPSFSMDDLSLGLNLTAGMILFMGGGYYLDRRLDTGHFWTLAGIVVALFYCWYEAWKIVRKSDSRKDNGAN